MEKIKKIRQSFSNPMRNVGRSGSRKIELEDYDTLTYFFSLSASDEQFNFGLESSLAI